MSIGVGLGLMEFPFPDAQAYWSWVDLCEEGGVDSLWQTDRIVSSEPILECMSAMAALAGRTRRIKFGVNVVSLALRDPVLVAKQCATIDVLSDGRLLPAFGIGSPRAPEWATLHLDTGTRGRKTDEGLEIIGRLWREDKVDFAGVHYRLSGASIAPKPVQAALPMWIGGSSPAAIRRTARYGTGWQAGPEAPIEVGRIVNAIRTATTELGRSIDADHYGAGFPFYFGPTARPHILRAMDAYTRRTGTAADGYFAIGDADIILARLAEYIEAGICKFVLRPLGADGAEVMAQTRRLIAEVLPKVAARWPKPSKQAGKQSGKQADEPA
jgi:probable F420-dependent oxidoreductase